MSLTIDRAVQGDVEGELAERRKHERRWRSAPFFIVERRNGDLWKYGSIALCIALLTIWGRLLLS
jgi:hypothetical protein